MNKSDLLSRYQKFLSTYREAEKDRKWSELSASFRRFWDTKIVNGNTKDLTDDELDSVIRILDRNGKGNTKESESVARAMVPQDAWRRLFRELCDKKALSNHITSVFEADSHEKKAKAIDALYAFNEGIKNRLTGPSGNVINSMLATYDPTRNMSMISLNDRLKLIEYLKLPLPAAFEQSSLGFKFAESNRIILEGFSSIGITGSSRTISCFCYDEDVQTLWRNEAVVTKEDVQVIVTIPQNEQSEVEQIPDPKEPRESIIIQALLARIGEKLQMSIWLPRSDRGRVLQHWAPEHNVLLEQLPLNFNAGVNKTIENIDVLWFKKNSIIRAFEVEHTTSIYSGLLRMADLVSLVPNISLSLHIVAPSERQEKVFEEIKRPVFSFLEGGALSKRCTYISYESVLELAQEKHLNFMKNEVIDNYAEPAE